MSQRRSQPSVSDSPAAPGSATNTDRHTDLTRRSLLGRTAGLAALGAAGSTLPTAAADAEENSSSEGPAITKGRINQSVVAWCFTTGEYVEPLSMKQLASHAKRLGMKSVELVGPEHFPMLKKMGLTCAIAQIDIGGPPFMKGFNNPRYHDLVIESTRKTIDACAEHGIDRVIAFTGYTQRDVDDPDSGHIDRDEGLRNCVAGFKKILPYAEKKGITLCLEMLNTRDDSHPMKGHPGYQGDSTAFCNEIIDRVGSEHLKLLFDVYHVQIMEGDIIRRIHQQRDYIGHIHTAGNPGRGEPDQSQELQYPAIMQALLEIGYDGYVGQEFIPTRDPIQGLRHAAKLCDV
jgi:hydroxypyruvate isomerase